LGFYSTTTHNLWTWVTGWVFLFFRETRERNTERKFKLVTNLHARIQPGREKNEKEREPTGERERRHWWERGTSGRSEKFQRKRFFVFKEKNKKAKAQSSAKK
jgi:hypothetical protein